MVLISEVAAHAGVSTATVSRVLSGEDHVSPELTERVWKSTQELGYRPNRIARRLRRPGRGSWAFIVPDVENRFFTSVARGVEQVASDHDITVFIGNTDHDPQRLKRYVETAVSEQVAGVILAPASPVDDVSPILASGIPIVTVDQGLHGLPLDTVMTDHYTGGRLAGELLLRRGYRRIGVVAGPQFTPDWNTRLDGLNSVLGDRADVIAVERGDNKVAGGMRAMSALLDNRFDLDAVFVTNNLMTIGALRTITSRGLEVPSDLDVVGYDLNSEEWAWTVPISAINQDPRRIGEVAAHILLERKVGEERLGVGEVHLLEPKVEEPAVDSEHR